MAENVKTVEDYRKHTQKDYSEAGGWLIPDKIGNNGQNRADEVKPEVRAGKQKLISVCRAKKEQHREQRDGNRRGTDIFEQEHALRNRSGKPCDGHSERSDGTEQIGQYGEVLHHSRKGVLAQMGIHCARYEERIQKIEDDRNGG